VNEEALAHWGAGAPIEKRNLQVTALLCLLHLSSLPLFACSKHEKFLQCFIRKKPKGKGSSGDLGLGRIMILKWSLKE
jgi:hypothetical protein